MFKEGKIKPIYEKIAKEAGEPSAAKKEKPARSAEERAEELYALWIDYRRLQVKSKGKEAPSTKEKLEKLRAAIAERWHEPQTQAVFKDNLDRSIAERMAGLPALQRFKQAEKEQSQAISQRDRLYREIFTSRVQEPDELTLLELAEVSSAIQASGEAMKQAEEQDISLARRLSFERLRRYQKELRQGFIWTPSRERYFDEILEHLVILDQNRPLLLYGETGTGKTRLARALSERLTGEPPYEVGEEAKEDIRPLLGSKSLDKEGSYITYGPLGQALTGKKTSRDKKAGKGGLFYMDEMNGYPAEALRSLIKQIAGRRPGEEVTFAAWAGEKEAVAPEFGFMGSANLPSEKHPDRPDLPVEVARELSSLEVDYPPQTPEDPELYEMMLAALLDQNGRLRLPKDQLAPVWEKVMDPATKSQRFELKTAPEAGGTLWRFAQFIAEIQKSYKGEENILTPKEHDASYLRQAVLDPGLVFSWLQEYRKSALRQGKDLQTFLAEKLKAWSGQKIYPEEDRHLLEKFIAEYNLRAPEKAVRQTPTIFSSKEIGALSPRVPRTSRFFKETPPPEEGKEYLEDGRSVVYRKEALGELRPETSLVQKGDKSQTVWVFKGLMEEGRALLKSEQGEIKILEQLEVISKYERLEQEGEALYRETRERFGENFLGLEEIERAFTLQDGSQLIEFSPEERERALALLQEKLNEPDIKEFLAHASAEQLKQFALILRPAKFKDGHPLTMKALEERLAPDMVERAQGKLFYNIDWYQDEDFYTRDTPSVQESQGMSWALQTLGVIPETSGKNHDEQTEILKKQAKILRLDPKHLRRRKPIETIYDFATILRSGNKRILEGMWDWSDIRSSDGPLVYVGDCDADGAGVDGRSLGDRDGALGVSLSR